MSANLTATMNGTQSSCFNLTALKIGKTFASCFLSVVSLVANTLIGLIVYKTKTLKKPINFCIVNMAMSDLLFPIFLFPQELVLLYTESPSSLIGGTLGQALCKLVTFAIDVSAIVSIQSLELIAVDRFVAVVFPLRSLLISSKLYRLLILATWIIAMAVCCPLPLAFNLIEHRKRLSCEPQWKGVFGDHLSYRYHTTAYYVVFIYFPFALISILYFAIALKIKLQKTPGEQSANGTEQRLKRERNVVKMSVVIVMVFAVCCLPLLIVSSFVRFSTNSTLLSCTFHYFLVIANYLSRSYCAVNPCVCFFFSENYRRALNNLLKCS